MTRLEIKDGPRLLGSPSSFQWIFKVNREKMSPLTTHGFACPAAGTWPPCPPGGWKCFRQQGTAPPSSTSWAAPDTQKKEMDSLTWKGNMDSGKMRKTSINRWFAHFHVARNKRLPSYEWVSTFYMPCWSPHEQKLPHRNHTQSTQWSYQATIVQHEGPYHLYQLQSFVESQPSSDVHMLRIC